MSPLRHVLFSFASLWLAAAAFAQVDTGAIVGTVTDSDGAQLAKTTVILHNDGVGGDRTTVTASDGSFSFSPLPIGTYTISAEHEGFTRIVKNSVPVTAQATLREDFRLVIGSLAQTVSITAATPQLETQSSALQQLVNRRSINDLPLNGRNVTFLAQTAPGVTFSQADSRGLAASGSFSANGARRGQNDYLLDGIDDNAAIADYVNQTQ